MKVLRVEQHYIPNFPESATPESAWEEIRAHHEKWEKKWDEKRECFISCHCALLDADSVEAARVHLLWATGIYAVVDGVFREIASDWDSSG